MAKQKIITLGLDLSLTGTGVIILENGKIIKRILIKSKPVGDLPIDELKRIQKIVSDIENTFQDKNGTGPYINVAVIEGLAFMVRNATALVQLSALNYMTRALLKDHGIPFVIVAPTSLKKFVTGSGASKKDVMLMETFKRYNVSILNDNECDAFGLAKIGEALLMTSGPRCSLPIFQQEVLDLLDKQIKNI
jgi:Holliday junction resolvasome RuvABC endonuclease subunit